MFLFLVTALPASACSAAACLDQGVEMQPAFSVKVSHDGKPLAGVTVEITTFAEGSNSKVFSATTKAHGNAHVLKLPPGNYWLKAELLGVIAGSHCFHVATTPSGRAKRRLKFDWGDLAPSTRSVRGQIIDSQPGKGGTPLWNLVHRVDVPITNATLRLQNPISGAAYRALSDSNGQFLFSDVPQGAYVLHVDGGGVQGNAGYEGADLLVKVSPKADGDELLLSHREAGGGSCGGLSLKVRNGR